MSKKLKYIFAFFFIIILLGCSSEEEKQNVINSQYRQLLLLDYFSFCGGISPNNAWVMVGDDFQFEKIEIYSSEEEARAKHPTWEENEKVFYAAPTEMTFYKIEALNKVIKESDNVEVLKEYNLTYPITIVDFVKNLENVLELFGKDGILSSSQLHKIISDGEWNYFLDKR